MDYNKLKNSMQRIENANKPRSQKILEKMGAKFNGDGNIIVDLKASDGTNFGAVTYDAYKAIERNTLDSYKPKNEAEKTILNNYRSHPGFELKAQDGKSFGKVSYDTLNAVNQLKVDGEYIFSGKMKSDEIKAFKAFSQYAGYDLKDANGKSLGKLTYDGYIAATTNNFDYQPKENEKTTWENVKKIPSIPLTINLKGTDYAVGTISYNTYKAMIQGDATATTAKAIPENEKQIATRYLKALEDIEVAKTEPDNLIQGVAHSLGYSAEKVGAGLVDTMADGGD